MQVEDSHSWIFDSPRRFFFLIDFRGEDSDSLTSLSHHNKAGIYATACTRGVLAMFSFCNHLLIVFISIRKVVAFVI